VSTTPYSLAGHAGTHAGLAKFKMESPLQSMQVLDGQTSKHASLRGKHCRSVSTTPCSVAGHPEKHSAARFKMKPSVRSVHVLGAQTSRLAAAR
jgi:hypothetical protein